MHYLIDGYNLLFRLPKSKSSFQKKRERLIEELHEMLSPAQIQATIIFDASSEEYGLASRSHYVDIEIIYTTKGMSADAYILRYLEEHHQPQCYCVVSSDLDLIRKSRALGAKTKELNEFFSWVKKKERKRRKQAQNLSFREFKESGREMARLLMIFEKRFLEDMTQDSSD